MHAYTSACSTEACAAPAGLMCAEEEGDICNKAIMCLYTGPTALYCKGCTGRTLYGRRMQRLTLIRQQRTDRIMFGCASQVFSGPSRRRAALCCGKRGRDATRKPCMAASKSPAAVQAVCTLSNARQAVSWQSHRQTCVSAMEPEGSSQCSLQLLVPSRAALASLQHFDRPPMSVIRTAMQKP